jgi:hypothetical protein
LLGTTWAGDCKDSQYCLISSFRKSPNALVGFARRAASKSLDSVGKGLERERIYELARGREAVNAIVAGVCFGGKRGVLSTISIEIELYA